MNARIDPSPIISDMQHQAMRHDLEAVRIRSAISVICDLYGIDDPAAEHPADPFGVNSDVQPERVSETEPTCTDSTSPAESEAVEISAPHSQMPGTSAPEQPTEQNSGATAHAVAEGETAQSGKPAGASAPAAPRKTREQQIRDILTEHPDWWAAKIAEAIGCPESTVTGTATRTGIKLPHRPTGSRRSVDGEMPETANRRKDVARLHKADPDLTPAEAAARLMMPLSTLRTFTHELGIEWATEPLRQAKPVEAPGRTKIDRVRFMHEQHPAWTARMIANALGEKETVVSTLLGMVRKAAAPKVVPL